MKRVQTVQQATPSRDFKRKLRVQSENFSNVYRKCIIFLIEVASTQNTTGRLTERTRLHRGQKIALVFQPEFSVTAFEGGDQT